MRRGVVQSGESRGGRKGGARKGAGRPSHYGEPLGKPLGVRLSAECVEALRVFCEAHDVHASALLREAALKESGAGELGLGLRHFMGKASKLVGIPCIPSERYVMPVHFTARQRVAVNACAKRRGLPVGQFVRAAAMRAVKRPDLATFSRQASH